MRFYCYRDSAFALWPIWRDGLGRFWSANTRWGILRFRHADPASAAEYVTWSLLIPDVLEIAERIHDNPCDVAYILRRYMDGPYPGPFHPYDILRGRCGSYTLF